MALSIPLPTQESDMLHLELVFINLQARDREEALSFLAQRMAALGVVSPDFPAAVLAREKAFPTGLQMPEAALALPHTETRFVLQPALAAAVLAEPVEFIAMGTEMQRLPVRLIFMPAVLHPDDQIQWLYRLMTVCQTPGFLPRLLQSPDRASFLGFLRAALNAVPR
ncbi:MAG: PTS sugar transporter subunit IIA [Chloroflexi bacterium]|jgi:PTS system galactitol-specific IIA component|nr:PTS sugar transporter subunit IIA [Chloroflexota bacterium]HOE35405.1 PTS sugar transporter subunit IIA [Anaerolineaceae bacterium]HOT25228.1 PTS sugar transporter subunit IIA [Anaerolineaceae bacterium]HQH57832.1 PTS sugar transporter subunit IIA [Anaerolineaceae bacterium]HQK02922.1 PTS sugar transporter subunit IIA [Anaerolineaceae bacterium]